MTDIFGDLAKPISEFSGDNSSAKDPWDEAGVAQQGEKITGEWIVKPNIEILDIIQGESRLNIRFNPAGKIGIGIDETDYHVTARFFAEISAKLYCEGKLVEQRSICYEIKLTKTIIIGMGVSIAPYSWYNTAHSAVNLIGKIPDGIKYAEYYFFFMDALKEIGDSVIVPQVIAEEAFRN